MTYSQLTNAQITDDGVELIRLTQELTCFRQRLEIEADQPVYQLEVNAATFLSDLAGFMGLDVAQHDLILGQPAIDYLTCLMETKIVPITAH